MSPNQHENQSANRPNLPINLPGPAATGHHPSPEDLIAYAMQFFTGEESAAIAYHLEQCAECRAELARIHDDLAATALTVDLQSPPQAARQRLLDQVAREKKIRIVPAVQAQAQAQTAPPSTFGRSGSIFSIEDAERPKKRPARVFLGVAGWAIAAALAVAVNVQYKDRQAQRNNLTAQADELLRLNTEAASAHQLMDALTDPRAVRVTLTLTAKPQPKATPIGGVTYNPAKGTLVFLASALDPLQTYKAYELWVIPADGSAPIPAGTFHPDDQGNASVIMPDLPKGVAAKAFGVTVEADGGAKTPTPPIIMAGS